jgi:hypothetical protein
MSTLLVCLVWIGGLDWPGFQTTRDEAYARFPLADERKDDA